MIAKRILLLVVLLSFPGCTHLKELSAIRAQMAGFDDQISTAVGGAQAELRSRYQVLSDRQRELQDTVSTKMDTTASNVSSILDFATPLTAALFPAALPILGSLSGIVGMFRRKKVA